MKDIENKAWNSPKTKKIVCMTTKMKISKSLLRIKV